jgi:hypothetical protein
LEFLEMGWMERIDRNVFKETYTDIELVRAQISARVGSLHNHLLSRHSTTCEGKFITGTAPGILASTSNIHSCISICQVICDSPGSLVRAHVCSPSIAARYGVGVSERVVVNIACLHGS